MHDAEALFIRSPRSDIRFRDHSMARDALAVKIRSFTRADQIRSGFHLNFNLALGYSNAAAIRSPPDTKTCTQIFDVGGVHLYLQFLFTLVFDVEISITSQQFNARGFGITDSDGAVVIKADVDVRRRRHSEALPRNGLMNSGGGRFCDKP